MFRTRTAHALCVHPQAHRGDTAAADPVTPVDVAEQQRALQLVLQVVSQDFWLPAARVVPLKELMQ